MEITGSVLARNVRTGVSCPPARATGRPEATSPPKKTAATSQVGLERRGRSARNGAAAPAGILSDGIFNVPLPLTG